MTAYKKIRAGMRANEVSLLAHLRSGTVNYTSMFGRSWLNALDRLMEAKMVRYDRKKYRYVARKGARPVTGAAR